MQFKRLESVRVVESDQRVLSDMQVADQYANLVRKWADRFPRVTLGPAGGVHFSIYVGRGQPRAEKFTPLAECRRVLDELTEGQA